jgi:hypothetical protein
MMASSRESNGPSYARVGSRDATFGTYARSYWAAAESLVDAALDGRGDADTLVYPILYMYRHATELALKDGNAWLEVAINARVLLRAAEHSEHREFRALLEEVRVHDLESLVARLERRLPLLLPVGNRLEAAPNLEPGLRSTVIALDNFDRDGQRCRYPFLSGGRGASFDGDREGGATIDLERIRDTVGPILEFLLDDLGSRLTADAKAAQRLYQELAAGPPPDEFVWDGVSIYEHPADWSFWEDPTPEMRNDD